MTQIQQQKAAKEFAERWKDKGYEKGDSLMAAYGFSTKMTESECVAHLFELYQKLSK